MRATSGHQLCTGSLDDLVRFTGEERLVDSCLSAHDLSVSGDLVARPQNDHISQYQFVDRYLGAASVADRYGIGLVQDAQAVQYLLGVQLLKNTDQSIRYDHRQKSKAVESPRHDQQKTDDQKDQVEIGKYVFFDDVLGRLRGPVDLHIDLALGGQLPDLRHLQSYLFYFNHL